MQRVAGLIPRTAAGTGGPGRNFGVDVFNAEDAKVTGVTTRGSLVLRSMRSESSTANRPCVSKATTGESVSLYGACMCGYGCRSRDGGFQAVRAAGKKLQIRTLFKLKKKVFYSVNFRTF